MTTNDRFERGQDAPLDTALTAGLFHLFAAVLAVFPFASLSRSLLGHAADLPLPILPVRLGPLGPFALAGGWLLLPPVLMLASWGISRYRRPIFLGAGLDQSPAGFAAVLGALGRIIAVPGLVLLVLMDPSARLWLPLVLVIALFGLPPTVAVASLVGARALEREGSPRGPEPRRDDSRTEKTATRLRREASPKPGSWEEHGYAVAEQFESVGRILNALLGWLGAAVRWILVTVLGAIQPRAAGILERFGSALLFGGSWLLFGLDALEGRSGLAAWVRSFSVAKEPPKVERSPYQSLYDAIARGMFEALSKDARKDEQGEALVDPALAASFFRPTAPEPVTDYDRQVFRFRTSHWTQNARNSTDAWERYERMWLALKRPIMLHGRSSTVKFRDVELSVDDERHEFVVSLVTDAPPFPGDQTGDERTRLAPALAACLAQREDRGKKVTEVQIGVDQRGNALTLDLAEAPHTLVVGASKSGKSYSGVISPLLQLAAKNGPNEVAFWVVDPKRELERFLGRLPHTRRLIHTENAGGAMRLLDDLRAECTRRRAAYKGEDWHPGIGDPFIVAVIEEYQVLISNSIADGDKDAASKTDASIGSLGALARSVGCTLLVASQKGTSEVIRGGILQNLSTRIVGRVGAPELRLMFGEGVNTTRATVHPGKKGRLAVSGPGILDHEDDVTQVHGLWSWEPGKPPADIGRAIEQIIERSGGPRAATLEGDARPERPGRSFTGFDGRSARPSRASAAETVEPDDEDAEDLDDESNEPAESSDEDLIGTVLPRMPSQGELFDLGPHVLLRALFCWQLEAWEEHPTLVGFSQRTYQDWLAGRDLRAGNTRRIIRTLATLERAGVLKSGANQQRQLAILTYPMAVARLDEWLAEHSNDDSDNAHDEAA